MPSRVSPPPAQGDELDDLFNYDAGMDDVFKDLDNTNNSNGQQGKTSARTESNSAAGLGIDEEIKVRKQRQPIAKLDEDRLLSAAGMPKLRRISKQRPKFKGKGHEFSDVARLLNTYQLWLDDLYPRAKFTDGLAIIEKLGHKKRMQIMRKEWIYEKRPKPSVEDDVVDEPEASQDHEVLGTNPRQDVRTEDTRAGPASAAAMSDRQEQAVSDQPGSATGREAGKPEVDELDALLAEDAMRNDIEPRSLFGSGSAVATSSIARRPNADELFEDEMEVMAGLDW